MSDTASSLKDISVEQDMSPQQVADYLIAHPDFLEVHSYLLTQLTVKHQSGQSISLVERQLAVLRQENQQIKQQLAILVNTARQNDELFEKSRDLVLRLISSGTAVEIQAQLEKTLVEKFGCSAAKLWLLDDIDDPSTGLISPATAKAALPRFIDKQHPFCGLLDEQEKQTLFIDQADKIGSAAILPLRQQNEVIGLLAIANTNKDYYRENMSTSLLCHIGQVTAELLRTLKK